MELIELVHKELELREQGERGKLGNLSNLELIALAYRLGIYKKPT